MWGAPATLSLSHARTLPEDFLAIARPLDAGRTAGFSDGRGPAVADREWCHCLEPLVVDPTSAGLIVDRGRGGAVAPPSSGHVYSRHWLGRPRHEMGMAPHHRRERQEGNNCDSETASHGSMINWDPWQQCEADHRVPPRRHLAPFIVQDVEHVVWVPRSHLRQTATH
jgi:hypothetical protein